MRHRLYWGIVLSFLNNPQQPGPGAQPSAWPGCHRKGKVAAGAGDAERSASATIMTLSPVMYVDYDKSTHQARVQSYVKAMEASAAFAGPTDDFEA